MLAKTVFNGRVVPSSKNLKQDYFSNSNKCEGTFHGYGNI